MGQMMTEASLGVDQSSESEVILSPWVTRTRRREAKRPGRLSSMSSLFDDMDPDHSPMMKNLERKQRTGEAMTEEDFLEPFPVFKKKMEREFDEITEHTKRLSLENPDEEMAEAVTNFSLNIFPDHSQKAEVVILENNNVQSYPSKRSIRWKNDVGTFLASQLAPLLMEELMNVLTNMIC